MKNNHNPYKALETTFGIDLMKDNVIRCRERVIEEAGLSANDPKATEIVQARIVQGNTLETNIKELFRELV